MRTCEAVAVKIEVSGKEAAMKRHFRSLLVWTPLVLALLWSAARHIRTPQPCFPSIPTGNSLPGRV